MLKTKCKPDARVHKANRSVASQMQAAKMDEQQTYHTVAYASRGNGLGGRLYGFPCSLYQSLLVSLSR
jgi:hypothetical protein